MKYQTCPQCGEPVSQKWVIDGHRHICPICGTISYPEDDIADKIADADLRSIFHDLDTLEFQDAQKKLGGLLESFPDDSRLYFLSALADCRVCYTVDSRSDKRIPTLNDVTDDDISHHPMAKKSLEKAESETVKKAYSECFDYLDSKRHEILRDKERFSYDIFISVKVHQVDERGEPVLDNAGNPIQTEDCKRAFETYYFLRQNFPGLKVFFSESQDAKSLMAGNRYENIIYAALHSAKLFLLIAESRENIVWRWVRNEWKRYLFSLQHEKEKGDRRLVLYTAKLRDRDLPHDLRGIQFIDASNGLTSTKVLEKLINDLCYKTRASETIHRIDAKTFDKKEPQAAAKPQTDTVSTKQLKRYKEVSSNSLQATLDRIAFDLNPAYPELRAEAFTELEALLKEHKDLYPARKMLLLKGTDIASLDEYVSSPNLIIDNPDIMKSFLDFASVEDGSLALTTLANTLGEQETLNRCKPKIYVPILDEQIIPYRENVSREALQKIVDCVKNSAPELNKTTGHFNLYRRIIQIWDYLDPKGHLSHRLFFYDLFKGDEESINKKSKNPLEIQEFCLSMLREAHLANPEDYRLAYEALCFNKKNVKSYEEALGDFLYCGDLFANAALDEDKLSYILSLLRNGKENDKRYFLTAFLFSLTQDPRTEGKKEGNDGELSPFALFLRYIGYPLPELFPVEESHLVIDGKTPIDPSPEAYRFKDNPSGLDGLLSIFGYELHKRGRYEEAMEIYGYYLGEQGENADGPDVSLIRCYRALCACGAPSFAALPVDNDLFDHRALSDALIAGSKSHPEVRNLYDKLRDAYLVYRHNREINDRIRPLLEKFEQLGTWDSLDRSQYVEQEINALLKENPEEFKDYVARVDDLRKPLRKAEEMNGILCDAERLAEQQNETYIAYLGASKSKLKQYLPEGGISPICVWDDAEKKIKSMRDYCKKNRFASEEGKQEIVNRVERVASTYKKAREAYSDIEKNAASIIHSQQRKNAIFKVSYSVLLMLLVGGVALGLLATPFLFLVPEEIRTILCLDLSFALPAVAIGAAIWNHFDEDCREFYDSGEFPTILFRCPGFFLPFIVPVAAIALSLSDFFFLADGPLKIAAMVTAYSAVFIQVLLASRLFGDDFALERNVVSAGVSFFAAALPSLIPIVYAGIILYGGWGVNVFEVGFLTGYANLPLWVEVCAPVGLAVAVLLFLTWWRTAENDSDGNEDIYGWEDYSFFIAFSLVLVFLLPIGLGDFVGSFVLLFAAMGGNGTWANVGWSFLYTGIQLIGFALVAGFDIGAYFLLDETLVLL